MKGEREESAKRWINKRQLAAIKRADCFLIAD